MNILIKLMSIVSLVIAPSLALIGNHGMDNNVGENTHLENGIQNQDPGSVKNVPYSDFLSALDVDGYFDPGTTTTVIVQNGHIKVGNTSLEDQDAAKYLPLLHGTTDIELHFTSK